mmetsp:Transcript_53905/g.154800  ORF Transcript_53905/g.154800 Transcript_53905/m.154800 type:complete len:259 (-) Transcript_53905:930-1706(-)
MESSRPGAVDPRFDCGQPWPANTSFSAGPGDAAWGEGDIGAACQLAPAGLAAMVPTAGAIGAKTAAGLPCCSGSSSELDAPGPTASRACSSGGGSSNFSGDTAAACRCACCGDATCATAALLSRASGFAGDRATRASAAADASRAPRARATSAARACCKRRRTSTRLCCGKAESAARIASSNKPGAAGAVRLGPSGDSTFGAKPSATAISGLPPSKVAEAVAAAGAGLGGAPTQGAADGTATGCAAVGDGLPMPASQP